MQQFAAGDHAARARAIGVLELREMAQRFNDMAAKLARRRDAQTTFLAGIAHDLRNPLSPLKVAASVLAGHTPALPEDVRKLVQVIGRQVDHLDRIVGDLLDTTRIEAGRFELRLESADAAALAGEAVELFRPVAVAHGVAVCVPAEPAWVRCDPVRLQQVLNNLLSNAIKYSPRGGQVLVTVTRDAERVCVTVQDEGIGMSEDEVRGLFVPFRRARPVADSLIPGVGLGLYIARRIVEAHGGELSVRSAPGAGSTFSLTLPAAGEPAAQPTGFAPARPA
jgi:signal transduction histidine kinase